MDNDNLLVATDSAYDSTAYREINRLDELTERVQDVAADLRYVADKVARMEYWFKQPFSSNYTTSNTDMHIDEWPLYYQYPINSYSTTLSEDTHSDPETSISFEQAIGVE